MSDGLQLEGEPRRIALMRALRGLGDLLCLVPALRALRRHYPDAEITLIGLPSARAFVERYPEYVDELLEFPGFPGIPEVPVDTAELPSFFARTQGAFDLALQMQGSGTHSNAFVALLGARRTAGCYLPSLWCPDPETYLPYPAHRHEVQRWLDLLEFLGVSPQGEHLEFRLEDDDRRRLIPAFVPEGRYVCLHPGAHEAERRWPASLFARVGDELARLGYEVALTGTEAEAPLTAKVQSLMQSPALDLAGRTDLGSLAALLQDSDLLICNDTGVSHLAAALRAPSIVIFAASDPERWAPLDVSLHRPVGRPMPERANACVHTREIEGHRCLRDGCCSLRVESVDTWRQATVDEVMAEALALLAERPAQPARP